MTETQRVRFMASLFWGERLRSPNTRGYFETRLNNAGSAKARLPTRSRVSSASSACSAALREGIVSRGEAVEAWPELLHDAADSG